MPKVFTIEGEDYLEKKVSFHDKGSSGYVYVPKEWAGKKVAVIKLE